MLTNNQLKIQQIQTSSKRSNIIYKKQNGKKKNHNHRKTWLIFDASERFLSDPVENEQGIKHLFKTYVYR